MNSPSKRVLSQFPVQSLFCVLDLVPFWSGLRALYFFQSKVDARCGSDHAMRLRRFSGRDEPSTQQGCNTE